MFREARLKLTGWYLLIIMLVSLAFSAIIYTTANRELQRFAEGQRARFERRIITPPLGVDDGLLEEARGRILVSLGVINLSIMLAGGILGYYLSGKTLSPIQEVMDSQYRFVSDASHELKTPITAIKTTLEVAMRDKQLSPKEARETLDTSLGQVNRLQKLAEGLLELSHQEVKTELRAASLNKVVESALKIIEPIARDKKIQIQVKIPQYSAMMDPERMRRVLLAILDNAIKYSPKNSKIKVAGKVVGKDITIAIKDSGPGIKERDLPLVFERFYRSDPARSTEGYGLGLSIAKQIIQEHHGKIEIESQVGKGTTVTTTLPYSAKLQTGVIN